MLNRYSENEICSWFVNCELWTVILWFELNPRVRCAFGNVYFVCLRWFCSLNHHLKHIFMAWLSKRCIITRKKEMFNLCDILLHHMNYSTWGILSRTKLTNIGILVSLNSHDHSNLDTKTNCDHHIHLYAIIFSCRPWSIPYHPWPLSAHSYFVF